MKNKKFVLGLMGLLGMSFIAHADPPVEEGKVIFASRCAACHNVNKNLTGPALAGIDERRSIEWITKFVNSSQTLIRSGDKDAVAVFEKFNKIPMPDHPDLSADHVKSIVEFIKSESKPIEVTKAPFAKPTQKKTLYKPLTIQKDYGFFIAFLVAVVMLISALVFVVHLNKLRGQAGGQNKSA